MLKRLFRISSLLLVPCLLVDPGMAAALSAASAPSHFLSHAFFEQEALELPGLFGPPVASAAVGEEVKHDLGTLMLGDRSPVPTIGINVTEEDNRTRTQPTVSKAMDEGRGLTLFEKGQSVVSDETGPYQRLIPDAIRHFQGLKREVAVKELEDVRAILIRPQDPRTSRAPPAFLWFESFTHYLMADAGRGADPAGNPQQQIYLPQSLLDRMLASKNPDFDLIYRVILHEAHHAREKSQFGISDEDEAELRQLRTELEPYLVADLEEWVANLATDAHGLSSNLQEVQETLASLARLAQSLKSEGIHQNGRRHLYQTAIRAIGLIAYETSKGSPVQQEQVIDLAMQHLTELGEVTPEQISWIRTLRNARANLQRIKDGEIEVNLALLQIPDPDIVQERNQERFMENHDPDTLVGRLNQRQQMAMSATAFQTGSGYGIFQTIDMIKKQFPTSRHEEAQKEGKIILNLLALSSGYGTRAGLLNVASFLDKGAIDLFDRTGIEQGMEQVLQLLGDPNLAKGLPAGEYFMVVPADNIILPDHNVGESYHKQQGAFLYALRRPVVGVDVGALNAISEFGLVQVGPGDLVSKFTEKPKRGREADRLKILRSVLSQAIENRDRRGDSQEDTYVHLWRVAEEQGLLSDLTPDQKGVFHAARLELLVLPALLAADDDELDHKVAAEVFYSLRDQVESEKGWMKPEWDAAWKLRKKLLGNAEIRQILQEIKDDAYLNTFYFLMSRPFVDSLWSTYDGMALEHTDPVNLFNAWKIPIKRRLGEGDTKMIDWSLLVLTLPTLRGTAHQDTLPHPLDKIYSPADIKNLTLFDLDALKEALGNPRFKDSQNIFMFEWMKRFYVVNNLQMANGDAKETWRQLGLACFQLLAEPKGTLFSHTLLEWKTHLEMTEHQFDVVKANAIDVLQEMGARWAVVKFGTYWRDRGDPRTAWATLQDANSKNIIYQMVSRLHFGLRFGLGDISKDSVVQGDVRFRGQHTVNHSVIIAPAGGRVDIGDDFIANHSILDFSHLPHGTAVKLARGLVVDHSDLPKNPANIIGKLAKAENMFIYRLYGEAGLSNVPDYEADEVMSTLFMRRNPHSDQGFTEPLAVSHALLDAEQMRAELNQPLKGLHLGEDITLQNVYSMRGELIDWKAQDAADKAQKQKLDDMIEANRPAMAALNPVEAHSFLAVMSGILSGAMMLHAPTPVLYVLLPWILAALGQIIAVIVHAFYVGDWRVLFSTKPIAVYDFENQREIGATSTFAHAHELARAVLQSRGAIAPRLIAPFTLAWAVLDDVVAGRTGMLPVLKPADLNGLSPWRPDLSWRERISIGIRALRRNSNAWQAASEFAQSRFAVAA